jgi:hypothetical protein
MTLVLMLVDLILPRMAVFDYISLRGQCRSLGFLGGGSMAVLCIALTNATIPGIALYTL